MPKSLMIPLFPKLHSFSDAKRFTDTIFAVNYAVNYVRSKRASINIIISRFTAIYSVASGTIIPITLVKLQYLLDPLYRPLYRQFFIISVYQNTFGQPSFTLVSCVNYTEKNVSEKINTIL